MGLDGLSTDKIEKYSPHTYLRGRKKKINPKNCSRSKQKQSPKAITAEGLLNNLHGFQIFPHLFGRQHNSLAAISGCISQSRFWGQKSSGCPIFLCRGGIPAVHHPQLLSCCTPKGIQTFKILIPKKFHILFDLTLLTSLIWVFKPRKSSSINPLER